MGQCNLWIYIRYYAPGVASKSHKNPIISTCHTVAFDKVRHVHVLPLIAFRLDTISGIASAAARAAAIVAPALRKPCAVQ